MIENLAKVLRNGKIIDVMTEIITQSRVEFNYAAQDEFEADEEEDLRASLDE